MSDNKQQTGFGSKLAIFLAAIAVIFSLVTNADIQSVKAQIEDATGFTGIDIQATALTTATPLLHIRNNGVSKSFEVENSSGTPVFDIAADGTWTSAGALTLSGALDLNGNVLTLDADADSTITADTDDQIDFAVSGTDSLTLTTTALIIEALGNTETANTTSGTQTVTPTTSVLSFAPSTVTTVTLATPTGDIKHLLIYNKNTTNTVIVDTGATAGGGNITLGQNDPVWFYWTGTLWMELLSPDNS